MVDATGPIRCAACRRAASSIAAPQATPVPKIIEHFGAAEVWGLKLTPEWVGTAGEADIPLPDNVRRYYIPSTQHGGGPGGFSTAALAAPACPEHRLRPGLARRPIRCRTPRPSTRCACISATGS